MDPKCTAEGYPVSMSKKCFMEKKYVLDILHSGIESYCFWP